MSLYALNLQDQKDKSMSDSVIAPGVEGSMYKSCFTSLHPSLSQHSTPLQKDKRKTPTTYGTPILHDTTIQLTVEKIETNEPYVNPQSGLDLHSHAGLEMAFGGAESPNPAVAKQPTSDSILKIQAI